MRPRTQILLANMILMMWAHARPIIQFSSIVISSVSEQVGRKTLVRQPPDQFMWNAKLALPGWTIFCLKSNTQPGSVAVTQGWKEAHLFTHVKGFVSNALPQLFDIVTWSLTIMVSNYNGCIGGKLIDRFIFNKNRVAVKMRFSHQLCLLGT